MASQASSKRRVALVGTGHRGTGMWGQELLAECGDWVDMVGLCDVNRLRLERARTLIGTDAPLFGDLGAMLHEVRPDTVIVCSRDSDHDAHIVDALQAGCDVITEKPMTTSAEKCRRVMEAQARTGRRLDVAFNYRYAPTSRKLKELLLSGVIGEIASVDFHWYLDTEHGADYFRRWHAHSESSGSLFVHKATHHFDLLNWFLELGACRGFCARRPAQLRPRRPLPLGALQELSACRNLRLPRRYRQERAPRSSLRGTVERGRILSRWLRLSRGDRHPGYHDRDDRLRERRADRLFAQHLHADRGLPSRLQRATGPDRAPAVRAPALADARSRRDPGDGELRADGAGHRPARAGRPFRRRRGAAPDAVRAGHGRPARPASRRARRCALGAVRGRGARERTAEPAGLDRRAERPAPA